MLEGLAAPTAPIPSALKVHFQCFAGNDELLVPANSMARTDHAAWKYSLRSNTNCGANLHTIILAYLYHQNLR